MRKRMLPIVLCIWLLLSVTLPVSAADAGSIAVSFEHQNQPVADAAFVLYQAAQWDGSEYVLTGSFADYPVKLADDPASEDWKAVASTLSAYAARDTIAPLASGTTDEKGNLRFDDLADGLYLLVGSPVELGDQRLFPQPMLVSVPFEKADGTLDHEVVVSPKYDTQKITEATVTRRALKIWKDEGNEDDRPQEVTVQLLCDGNIYDEQVLNTENNWSYTWEGLDAAHDWQLTETAVPENYTVAVTRQEITFTVTNTNDNPPPPTTPTTPPDTPPEEPTLPQTGLLWWPVPVLAGIGAVALFCGIFLLLRRKGGPDA